MTRLLQGFCFADAREKASTDALDGTSVAVSNVDATGNDYEATSGLDVFAANDLILASGFSNSDNNGLKTVTTAAAASLTVSETLVDETPSSDAKLEVVGYQATSGDLDVTIGTGTVSLESTTLDFTGLNLNVGEWIFIGGDTTATQFVDNQGYARISEINTNELVLDETTFTATAETGTGLTVQLFFGVVIRNEESSSLIVRRSYNVERQLGSDDNGVQSEYLTGAIPNEFTLNIPQADKLNADLSFVAMDSEQRDGSTGVKSGTRIGSECEDAFNTSSDIYRIHLAVHDDDSTTPEALFGYVSEATITINNNVTANKAVAVLGAFDATAGDFEVGGSITAYFTEVAAIQAVRNNSDVALNFIAASNNIGVVYDIPLISLGGGRLSVEKDSAITIPVDMAAAADCDTGYTLLTTTFAYLPDLAMHHNFNRR